MDAMGKLGQIFRMMAGVSQLSQRFGVFYRLKASGSQGVVLAVIRNRNLGIEAEA